MNMRFNYQDFKGNIHPLLDDLAKKSKEVRKQFDKVKNVLKSYPIGYDFDSIKILLYLFKNPDIPMTTTGFVKIYKEREGIKKGPRFINKRLNEFLESNLIIRGDDCEWLLTEKGAKLAKLILETLTDIS